MLSRCVAAAILAAVEGGILPPGMATLSEPLDFDNEIQIDNRLNSSATTDFSQGPRNFAFTLRARPDGAVEFGL